MTFPPSVELPWTLQHQPDEHPTAPHKKRTHTPDAPTANNKDTSATPSTPHRSPNTDAASNSALSPAQRHHSVLSFPHPPILPIIPITLFPLHIQRSPLARMHPPLNRHIHKHP